MRAGSASTFEFLLYDVTSTYLEGQAQRNRKAARGYSRDQRPDCKQVNIGLVVTPEGLPTCLRATHRQIGYEVFVGNTADVVTVEDMVRVGFGVRSLHSSIHFHYAVFLSPTSCCAPRPVL